MATAGAPLTAAVAVVAATLLANVGGVQSPPRQAPGAGGPTPQTNVVAGSLPKEIAFVDSAFPAVTAGRDGTINTSVFVRSSLDNDVCVLPVVAFRSASGGTIEPIELPETRISQSSAAFRLPIYIKSSALKQAVFPLNGWLSLKIVAPATSVLAIKPLEIKEISGPGTGAEWILLRYALILAFAGSLIAGFAVTQRGKKFDVLLHRMGSPTLTFSSWNSNLTIAGAIFAGLINFSGFPDHGDTLLSKKTYVIVSLMLAVLAALAPVAYNLFSKTVQAKNDLGASTIQSQGSVCMFLVAAFITMTGAIAQLGLMDLLVTDVAATGTLSPVTAGFWHYLLILLQVALWAYSIFSMTQTIEMQSFDRDDAEGSQPNKISRAGIQLDAATADNVKPQLPDWSLL